MAEGPVRREELLARAQAFQADPLAKRFRSQIKSDGDLAPQTPEDVFGHRLLALAFLIENACDETDRRELWPDMDADFRWRFADLISSDGIKATPHLWSHVGWHGAIGLEMPRHIVSPRSLSLSNTWHVFNYPSGNSSSVLLGLLIGGVQTGVAVIDIWMRAITGSIDVGVTKIPYGSVWPDDLESGGTKVRRVLQLLAFLSSPFIPRSRERMSRDVRRGSARQSSLVEPEDEVNFVLLRRLVDTRRERLETQAEVEWKHRWLVSGHLRAQWYPSEQAHHLIWIAPYVKGPEDAPLLEHVYKVVR